MSSDILKFLCFPPVELGQLCIFNQDFLQQTEISKLQYSQFEDLLKKICDDKFNLQPKTKPAAFSLTSQLIKNLSQFMGQDYCQILYNGLMAHSELYLQFALQLIKNNEIEAALN